MEKEKYKCKFNQEFTEKEFQKHFQKCDLFKKQYKAFDDSISYTFQMKLISPEQKKIGIFLLKQYIKVIN